MPDVSKMKGKKLTRKSFKSNKGLKKKRKLSKFNNEKAKQLQSKSIKTEESSDENVDSSDDELDQLIDSDTDLKQPTKDTSDPNNDETDYFERPGQISESSDDEGNEGIKHKHALEKLKETDPDFYKFLQQNDQKLLNFEVSGSESEAEDDEDVKSTHKLPDELQGASDESDFEEETSIDKVAGNVVTLQMVSDWQEQLTSNVSVELLTNVVSTFHAALQRVSNDEEEAVGTSQYRVDGSSVFNAVIQMCVLELQPALMRFLKLPPSRIARAQPAKAKRFIKIKTILKCYLADLLKLLGGVTSSQILCVLLKHLHQMTAFLRYYSKLTKNAIKKLVILWSTGEETVRVIAFLCILRLTTNQQKLLLDSVLKLMYVKYISNSKFVSVQTLPAITFMRRSLTEMFALDPVVSYQHAFLYIRQLAIHLRNAITLKKTECIQSVCNWQYMNSVKLWIDLLCTSTDKGQLQALLYPVVQIIIGCIKLVPTAQYLPLRFHYCELLVKLSKETGTFIPVLPLITEALTVVDFNKMHKKVSMKPMDLTCIFRVSKNGLAENGFKDAIVEHVYQLLMEYVACESYRMSFPDVMVPTVIQLRTFLKSCRSSKYSQKIKHLVTKIEENSKFIETERRKVSIDLSDRKSVEAWEANIMNKGTPLLTFYASWKKVHTLQMAKRATDNDKIGDYNLPVLKKRPAKKEKEEGPVELFPSDDSDDQINFGDDDDDDDKPNTKKAKRSKKKNNQKVKKMKTDQKPTEEEDSDSGNIDDIVEDFKLSDIE